MASTGGKINKNTRLILRELAAKTNTWMAGYHAKGSGKLQTAKDFGGDK